VRRSLAIRESIVSHHEINCHEESSPVHTLPVASRPSRLALTSGLLPLPVIRYHCLEIRRIVYPLQEPEIMRYKFLLCVATVSSFAVFISAPLPSQNPAPAPAPEAPPEEGRKRFTKSYGA